MLFHRAVGGMAPALIASIIPLLPVISHFAFDFSLDASDIRYVPPLTAGFRPLLNTKWFQAVSQTLPRKRKLY